MTYFTKVLKMTFDTKNPIFSQTIPQRNTLIEKKILIIITQHNFITSLKFIKNHTYPLITYFYKSQKNIAT